MLEIKTSSGAQQAIMTPIDFPPNESCKKRVIFDSLHQFLKT
jgi:hypothetical protein